MAIQNAQINIEKTHEEIPKDTAYEFSFQIIKPNYGDQEISRRAETKENPLGEGQVYEIDINKDKFVQINEAGTSTQAKFLIKDGLDYILLELMKYENYWCPVLTKPLLRKMDLVTDYLLE